MDLLSTVDVAIPAVFFPIRRGESAPAAGLLRVHAGAAHPPPAPASIAHG